MGRERPFYAFGLGLVASMLLSSPSHAWSDFVHELVCEMAFEHLSEPHQGEVHRLSIGENAAPGYTTFAASCNWADEVKRSTHLSTYEYHYLNVPRIGDQIDFARDCAAYDCVSQAVVRYALGLANHQLDEDRAEALRFLGHFVGDLHQPLHAGAAEDRGGNSLFVALPEGERADEKLHGIWDGTIPRTLGLRAVGEGSERVKHLGEIAKRLNDAVAQEQKDEWRHPSVKKWTRESARHSRECSYRRDCDPEQPFLENGDRLSEAYWARSGSLVEERIKTAAVRLAYLLELALDGKIDPVVLESE